MLLFSGAAAADPRALRAAVAQTLPLVAEVLGVPAPKHVTVHIVTHEAGKRRLLAGVHRDYPGDALARLGEALIAVGLAAPGTDLPKLAPPFEAENFSGFFDGDDHALYLVDDEPMERQRAIIAHELAHALQDDRLGLTKLSRARQDSEDASLALTAALEGQAQAVAAEVLRRSASPAGDAPDVGQTFTQIAIESAAEAAAGAPTPWLGLGLAWPYAAGERLFTALRKQGDPFGRAMWAHLPETTAQIEGLDDPPRRFELQLAKKLPGSKRPWSNCFGSAGLELLSASLHLGLAWRGDRVESVQLGKTPVVVWAVALDTEEHAAALASLWKDRDVERVGTTVMLLSNVPPARRAAIVEGLTPRDDDAAPAH